MKPFLLFLLASLFCLSAFPQASDFIVVKKRNDLTVKSYFPGLPISFETESGWVSGWITAIRNDSIFVKQYDVRTVPTIWGTTVLDTAGAYVVGTHYKEIKQIQFAEKGRGFGYVKDGTIFILGGLAYAVLNVVNGAYLHEPITDNANMKSLGIALGVAGGGFVLKRLHHRAQRHWKYKIEYIRMNDVKKQLRGF